MENPSYVVKPHDSDKVKPHDSDKVKPHDSDKVKPHDSDKVKPHDSDKVKPHDSDKVKPHDSDKVKPYVKDLSDMLSNTEETFSLFSCARVKTEVDQDKKISSDICQGIIKEEILLPSPSDCEVKEEIMFLYCQSCSYSDIDFGRLKSHLFTQHPTKAAIVANDFGKTDLTVHDVNFFCVKQTCYFSTTLCSVYEQHLMRCCPLHQNMSDVEKERLKSTIIFILDFHNKHCLGTVSGFLDYVSTFNEVFTFKSDYDKLSEHIKYGYSSSMLSESTPLSDVKPSMSCNNVRSLIHLSSSVSTPVWLLAKKSTDVNSLNGQRDSGRFGEQDGNYEELIKTNPYPSSNEVIHIHSSIDDLVSNNNELENDIAGKPLYRSNALLSECDKSLCQNAALTEHMERNLGQKPHECIECGKRFRKKCNLTEHLKTHTGERPFKCGVCSKSFRKKNDLTAHLRTHTGEKPFKCHECDKTFHLKSILIRHLKIHTGEKPFKCNECGKSFGHKSDLNEHIRVHTGEKPFKCHECGKCFSRSGNLTLHMETHTGSIEKPFQCNECGKKFDQSCSLGEHLRMHRGEKPFRCDECGKSFRKKFNFTEHLRIHTGEKPFKCNDCGKSFVKKFNLTDHLRTHSGEKPFKCGECGKTFHSKSILNRHLNIHIGEKSFKCNECAKSFVYRYDLDEHISVHTRGKTIQV